MLEKDINRVQQTYTWPDNYYMATDAKLRRQYLDEAIASDRSTDTSDGSVTASDKSAIASDKGVTASDGSADTSDKSVNASDGSAIASDKGVTASDESAENIWRLRLWNSRYADAKGKIDGVDHFMRGWMNLPFIASQKKGLFGARKYKKELEEFMQTFLLDDLAENEAFSDVFYREYLNFVCFYIQISNNDKSYSSLVLGIGKMPESSLLKKLAQDLCQKTIFYPKEMGIYEKQSLLAKAARDAFALYYPDAVDLYDQISKTTISSFK